MPGALHQCMKSCITSHTVSIVDYEERLMMQNEKLQVEVRMWELREQDLQEQFAFREQQIKRKYEERIWYDDLLLFFFFSSQVHGRNSLLRPK